MWKNNRHSDIFKNEAIRNYDEEWFRISQLCRCLKMNLHQGESTNGCF